MEKLDYENLLDTLNYELNAKSIREEIVKDKKYVVATLEREEEAEPDSYNIDFDISEQEMNNALEEKLCEEIEKDIKHDLKDYNVSVEFNIKNVDPSEWEDTSFDWEQGEQSGTLEGGYWTMATFNLEIEVWVEL